MSGNYQNKEYSFSNFIEHSIMGIEGVSLYGEATWKRTSKLEFSKGSTLSSSITTGTPFGFKTISKMSSFSKIGGPIIGAGLAAPDIYDACQVSNQVGNRKLVGASGGILGGAAVGPPSGIGAIATGIIGGVAGGLLGEAGVTYIYDQIMK